MKVVDVGCARPVSAVLDETEGLIIDLCTSLVMAGIDYRYIVGMLEDVKNVYLFDGELND